MNRFLPLHWDFRNQLFGFLAPLAVHTLWSCGFYSRLAQWYQNYRWNPTNIYPPFRELVGNGMACFYLVLAYVIIWGIVAYRTFFENGKNIYRLRRMPFGHGAMARCVVLPVFGVMVAVVWSAILLALQYWSYCANTPL